MPPRANPAGSATVGSFFVPKLPASLLKFPIRASLITVWTTNLTGALAAFLTPSQAFLIESFIDVNALPVESVARLNNGSILSRNQLATGAIMLSRIVFHAVRRTSRIRLNPALMLSITVEMTGQAVSRNQFTTGATTRSLIKFHAAFSASRIMLKPRLISSITSEITGHTHVWNHDTTAWTRACTAAHARNTKSRIVLNASGIVTVTQCFNTSRTGKITFSKAHEIKSPIAENTGDTTFSQNATSAGPRSSRTNPTIAPNAGLIALSHSQTAAPPIASNTG